jgi:sugar/nucleoside kinase (ribokinase family)
MSSIAAIGNLTLDRVADAPPRPGGAVYYSARALAQLGADAHIGASCAPEDRAKLVPPVEAFGVPVTWHESSTTTAFSFHYGQGGRRIMYLDAVGKSWSPDDAVEAASDAGWVHVGGLTRADFPPHTLAALSGENRKLLVDAQGLIRTAELGRLRTDGDIGDVLGYVTILKLDVEEAETLTGDADPERLRSLGVPEVILTLGPHGSVVITADAIQRVRAEELAGVVDPTGAGDTFSAGYLLARVAGADPVEAGRAATETVAAFLAAQ